MWNDTDANQTRCYSETPTCEWVQDDEGSWGTSCGNAFTLIGGTPSENNMLFCCYCGKSLRTAK